jgi:hypothetical protein
MIETVATIVTVPTKVDIDFCTLRKPEFDVLPGKPYRSIFGDLMLGSKSDLGYGARQFRFDPHNLKVVGCNPRPALEPDRVHLPSTL